MIENDGQLAGEGRIVGAAVGYRGGDHVAGAILVLQALTAERGSPRRRTDQESARALVRRGPDQVSDALESNIE